jgi:cation:H+ antiporter
MSLIAAVIFLAAGLIILWKAASMLVSGAVALADRLGVSPIVIGLTVVAMGTSAPEVAASIAAALRNAGDIAVGNVYGSNVANLALVGGLIALIRPVAVRKSTIKREIPAMILVALLLWPILANLSLARTEALLLLAIFVLFMTITVVTARNQARLKPELQAELAPTAPVYPPAKAQRSMKVCAALVVIGLAGLALGAELALRGAVRIGDAIGLSKAVIGLTIIAVGTSLPELVTCVVASLRRQDDISIGNLVGSNIFNTLLVIGTAGTVRPFGIGARLAAADYWIMVAVSIAFALLVIAGRRKVRRAAGALLFCAYVAYLLYLLHFTRSI